MSDVTEQLGELCRMEAEGYKIFEEIRLKPEYTRSVFPLLVNRPRTAWLAILEHLRDDSPEMFETNK